MRRAILLSALLCAPALGQAPPPPDASELFWEKQAKLFRENGWKIVKEGVKDVVVDREGLPVDPARRLISLKEAGRILPVGQAPPNPPPPTPPTPVPTRIVVTPPSKAGRLAHVDVQGDFKQVVGIFVSPLSACEFSPTSDPRSFVVAGDPGAVLDVVVFVQTAEGTFGQAVTSFQFPGSSPVPPGPAPVPPGPGPSPDPTPVPVPDDPDIILVGHQSQELAPGRVGDMQVAAVPSSVPLQASYVFDRDTSTFAQISLQTDAGLMATLKSFNASQRNYDAPRTGAEIEKYRFGPWVQKYGVPCMLWQRVDNGDVVAITKNPTRAKAESTLKALRGAK